MRKLILLGIVFGVAGLGGVAAAARLHSHADTWLWQQGDATASVGELAGSNALVLNAAGDINLRAHHVRLMSDDANWDLVHSPASPTAHINAYYIGTAVRTPVQIGGDSQTTTALVVAGTAGQRAALQQWTLSGKTVAAINGKGRLRLGNVTLDPEIVNGRVELYAFTGKGKQLLAVGAPSR